MRGLDLVIFSDQLFFTFEFSKITNFSNHSMRNLLVGIEATTNYLLKLEPSCKTEQNQINYTLYKFLVFFTDTSTDQGPWSVVERIVSYLMTRIKDSSKELSSHVYDRISAVSERNITLLRSSFLFLTESRFLDGRGFGVKCLLRILKYKTGFKTIREEILSVIYS